MSDSLEHQGLDFLRELELFASLDADILRRFATNLTSRSLAEDEVLVHQGELGHAMYIVRSGLLRADLKHHDGTSVCVGEMEAGDPVGEIQLILGGTRSATVTAVTACELLVLEREVFEEVVAETPALLDQITQVVTKRLRLAQLAAVLPSILGETDQKFLQDLQLRAEWVSLPRGEVLFRQGDPGDAWYCVTAGRLQVLTKDRNGVERVGGEVVSGEGVGEVAIVSDHPRTATVLAVRDTEMLKLSREAFQELLPRWPNVLMSVSRTLFDRLVDSINDRPTRASGAHIAILPASPRADISEFTQRLTAEISNFDATLNLSWESLAAQGVLPGPRASLADPAHAIRFSAWFEEQQQRYPYVLLEGERELTGWCGRAIREADHVLLVADARDDAREVDAFAAEVDELRSRMRGQTSSLVLVHPSSTTLPKGTAAWLERRPVDEHQHLRAGRSEDFARLARLLSGRAIGLALGGGGARGAAHIGVVRALREAQIPIDVVAGTSAGSIAAAFVAMELSADEMLARSVASSEMEPFRDYTLPMMSLVSSRKVDTSLRAMFGDVRLEDLWLDCVAVSSNLTTAKVVLHDRGPVWEAARASGSLPGVLPPVPWQENLLVDGGVLNNLPTDVARDRCGGPVIAVNVSPKEELARPAAGLPSPWKLLTERLRGSDRYNDCPGILSIIMRSSWLASVGGQEANQRAADLYLAPPIDPWGLLDFEHAREIAEAAYRYTMTELEKPSDPDEP